MDLKEYRWKHDVPYAQIARLIECNPQYVSRIANKHVKPSAKVIRRIVAATNGLVTAEELLAPWIKEKEENKFEKNLTIP